jgi:hypothetical protein
MWAVGNGQRREQYPSETLYETHLLRRAARIMGKILYKQENALGAFIMNCSPSLAGKHVIS